MTNRPPISIPNPSLLPKIIFRWPTSSTGWQCWVSEMLRDEAFVAICRDSGIANGIQSSVVLIKPDRRALEALFCFWSPATKSFLFPWGEASFTMEDCYVLNGGLPIRGSKLDRILTNDEKELETRLFIEREKIREIHPRGKVVTQDIWIDWFLELKGEEELKKLGFLACWLTCIAVPTYPKGEISETSFKMAARLYCGDRIALTPVVTANIYNDLSKIVNATLGKQQGKKGSNRVDVWAPLGLIQVWIWERFQRLRPAPANTSNLHRKMPRISRWDNKKCVTTFSDAVATFEDRTSYTWRPYIDHLGDWKEPGWYIQEPRAVNMTRNAPDWVHDFLAVISPSLVQGFYGDNYVASERYQPSRVARQFGYDQSVPSSNNPLSSYFVGNKLCKIDNKLYVPEITRCGNATSQYSVWWQKLKTNSLGTSHLKTKDLEKDLVLSIPAKVSVPIDKMIPSKRPDEKPVCNEMNSVGKKTKLDVVEETRKNDLVVKPEKLIVVVHAEEHNVLNSDAEDRRLVNELHEFVSRGLLSLLGPPSPIRETNGKNRMCGNDFTVRTADPYGQEAARMYPVFFKLIPQKPHYIGLLPDKVNEEIRRDVYQAQWFKLVGLMRRALQTSSETGASEFESLIGEAKKFEKLGFDVRHLVARLKEPHAQLKRLQEARLRLAEAKSREQNAVTIFRKEVEAAEKHLLALEHDLKAMNSNKLLKHVG